MEIKTIAVWLPFRSFSFVSFAPWKLQWLIKKNKERNRFEKKEWKSDSAKKPLRLISFGKSTLANGIRIIDDDKKSIENILRLKRMQTKMRNRNEFVRIKKKSENQFIFYAATVICMKNYFVFVCGGVRSFYSRLCFTLKGKHWKNPFVEMRLFCLNWAICFVFIQTRQIHFALNAE